MKEFARLQHEHPSDTADRLLKEQDSRTYNGVTFVRTWLLTEVAVGKETKLARDYALVRIDTNPENPVYNVVAAHPDAAGSLITVEWTRDVPPLLSQTADPQAIGELQEPDYGLLADPASLLARSRAYDP